MPTKKVKRKSKQMYKKTSRKKRTLKKKRTIKRKRTIKKKSGKNYIIIYHVAYKHMSSEKEPTENALETYIKKSKYIPENINYLNLGDYIKEPHYIKNNSFSFTIKNLPLSFLSENVMGINELADTILNQSFADGEWGASPGDGSFVYPDKAGTELGLLYYDYVIINGKKFKKKLL